MNIKKYNLHENNNLFSFLYYGDLYLPRNDSFLLKLVESKLCFQNTKPDIFKMAQEPFNSNKLINYGVEALENALDASFTDACLNGLNVIPLSGGLDSRSILAYLIEKVQKNNILTVTYGHSGTLDYNIGKEVAKKAGVNHVAIDTSSFVWNTERMVNACRKTGWDCFSTIAYIHEYLGLGPDNIYWTGFMGGTRRRSSSRVFHYATWQEAVNLYSQYRKLDSGSSLLPRGCDYDPLSVFPLNELVGNDEIPYDEQLNYLIHQAIELWKGRFLNGYDWRAPYIQPTWTGFALNLHDSYHENQLFYRKVLNKMFPTLFNSIESKSYPSISGYYKPLSQIKRKYSVLKYRAYKSMFKRGITSLKYIPNPGINQIELDWAMRERADVKVTVLENLEDLHSRGLINWMYIPKLFEDHQNKRVNNSELIRTLLSLELKIKAGILKV